MGAAGSLLGQRGPEVPSPILATRIFELLFAGVRSSADDARIRPLAGFSNTFLEKLGVAGGRNRARRARMPGRLRRIFTQSNELENSPDIPSNS